MTEGRTMQKRARAGGANAVGALSRADGDPTRDDAASFSEFNVELHPASQPGRYYVDFTHWVEGLRAQISLTRGNNLAGALLFVADDAAVPKPEEQPRRGGYVLYFRWADFDRIHAMLSTYKAIAPGTFGMVRKTMFGGTAIYSLNFTQLAREPRRAAVARAKRSTRA